MRFRKLQFAWGVAYTLLILGVIAEYGLGPAWPVWIFLTMLTLVGLEFVSFWENRSWRFSLRTLLIATTLVAVVLGLIASLARQ
jgi:hypothetical protein